MALNVESIHSKEKHKSYFIWLSYRRFHAMTMSDNLQDTAIYYKNSMRIGLLNIQYTPQEWIHTPFSRNKRFYSKY